jgi:hypothetical protein
MAIKFEDKPEPAGSGGKKAAAAPSTSGKAEASPDGELAFGHPKPDNSKAKPKRRGK